MNSQFVSVFSVLKNQHLSTGIISGVKSNEH